MQPQRPKRLPTDFFDRLLSNQTDDQINDLLSTLVDEQITPSAEAEKEEQNSEASMVFEPAEAPADTRQWSHPGMEETILSEEDDLELERPDDELIPSTGKVRTTEDTAELIAEPAPTLAPEPPPVAENDENEAFIFPSVPDDPTAAVETPESESRVYDPTPPIAPTGPEEMAADNSEQETLPQAEEHEPASAVTGSRPEITQPPEEEQSEQLNDIPATVSQKEEEAPQVADLENLFGMTDLTAPAEASLSSTEEDSSATEEPPSVTAASSEKILSHEELIHARINKRWQTPKRKPKTPKLAVTSQEVAVDQSKLSALDDYLQDRHKERETVFLSRIQRAAIWFILPTFIAFSLFSWYPMLKGLFLSFFNFQPTGESVFIGLQNYTRAFKDIMFLKTLWHGGLFCGLALLLGFIPPIFLSIFINEFRRGKGLIKFLFFLPFLMPTVPAAILWKWMLDQGYGLVNSLITLLPIADPHVGWLTNPNLAMLSIVLLYVWRNTGWAMLIYTAALLNIDTTLYEESEIHGATIWQKIRYITLPTIKGTIAVMFLITIINTIQLFTEVYIMTGGGPMNSTEVLATYIYKQAFFYMDIGYASALSFLMLVMLLVITIFRLRRLD